MCVWRAVDRLGEPSVPSRRDDVLRLVRSGDRYVMRAAQFVLRRADLIEQVAGRLQVHRHAAADVGDLAQGADQQRVRNLDRPPLAAGRRS